MNNDVKLISIAQIRILNPRHRDRKKFEIILQSIKNLGLKKPIHVSPRRADEDGGEGYDLVCGQGRIEAFMALGHTEIPAIVVNLTKEDRLLGSLVENMARRLNKPIELLDEILRLKERGYSVTDIGQKLDIDRVAVSGLLTLKTQGEERLIEATVEGKIPLGVALEIARTDGADMQRELLKAYEKNQLNKGSLRVMKRIMEHRRFYGKTRAVRERARQGTRTSADSLVNAYRRESQKQKLMIKKAQICESKLRFVVSALAKLMADNNFMTLLKAEAVGTMPKTLADRVDAQKGTS